MYSRLFLLCLLFGASSSGLLSAPTQIPNRENQTVYGAVTSTASGTHFEAFSARPIEELLIHLVQEHGFFVDYEDVEQTNPSLYIDTASAASKARNPNHTYMSPISRPYSYDTSLSIENPASTRQTLNALLINRNQTSGVDSFRIVEEPEGRLSVVANGRLANDGHVIPQSALLDTPILMGSGSQSAMDALEELVGRLTSASGKKVEIGIVPLNLLNRLKVNGLLSSQPARAYLTSILSAAPYKMVWFLLYDFNSNTYALSLVQASRYEIMPNGGRHLVNIPNQ